MYNIPEIYQYNLALSEFKSHISTDSYNCSVMLKESFFPTSDVMSRVPEKEKKITST